MSIYYDFHKQSGIFKGKEKVIARVTHQTTINSQTLFDNIDQGTSLTKADLIAAVEAIVSAMSSELRAGHRVHLNGLGYFSLTMDAEVVQQDNGHYKAKHPTIKTINFTPEKSFRQRFADVSFTAKKHIPNVARPLTKSQSLAAIETLFSESPAFTASQFAAVTQVPLSVAYSMLRELENEGVVKNIGTPRRKIYIRP